MTNVIKKLTPFSCLTTKKKKFKEHYRTWESDYEELLTSARGEGSKHKVATETLIPVSRLITSMNLCELYTIVYHIL